MTSVMTIEGRSTPDATPVRLRVDLRRDIRTSPQSIAKRALKDLPRAGDDVVTIAESVAIADRSITRHRSKNWSRAIELNIPVHEVDVFEKSEVIEALADALHFLTGDSWTISFLKRSSGREVDGYLPLEEERPLYIIPYSEGLDSFSQMKLLSNECGDEAVWTLRAGRLHKTNDLAVAPVLEVARGFRFGHPRELTYRTRPFVYFSFAGVAAVTVGAKAVVIGENGQGALGPSFARFANEWPFRSAHPGFVWRLKRYFDAVFGGGVEFLQPQLWRTKGEVLSELRERELHHGWKSTRSCSVRPLQRLMRESCGYCGGCLLRQTAIYSAGLSGEEGGFAFDASSPELALTGKNGMKEKMSGNSREILAHAALSMKIFAEVGYREEVGSSIEREAKDIPSFAEEDVVGKLRSLSLRHRAEWKAMLESLPTEAWMRSRFLEL